MSRVSRMFQVFVKPVGALCNLNCHYCYYLDKQHHYGEDESFCMPDIILEEYIVQHIEACIEPVIRFSWHGGEPTILGLDYFNKIVALQRQYKPKNREIINGIQTNGTLLDEEWGRFLAKENFVVGLSVDGPQDFHDQNRISKAGKSTFQQTMQGYEILQKHGINTDILCVVHAGNVAYPLEVYRFFKAINASYLSFLPLVEFQLDREGGLSSRTVNADAFGSFLCTIFDEWLNHDIGQIKVQIFEEAARTAFDQEHSLCIFRKTCGDIPVIEHNGDFFCCDHFVDKEHHCGNIIETHLVELLDSPIQKAFGQAKLDGLPQYCLSCEVRDMCNGGCPKNRFLSTPDGEKGLNYLCAGYKRFFCHFQPFVNQVAAQYQKKSR